MYDVAFDDVVNVLLLFCVDLKKPAEKNKQEKGEISVLSTF